MKRYVAVTLMAAQVAACATAPDKISASYVSPAMYSSYDCTQLRAEMQRIAYKVDEVTGAQQTKARNDEIAMGVGLVIFWPALFFLGMGSDRKAELQSLKGSYDAINEASIMHRCGMPDEPRQANANTNSAPVTNSVVAASVEAPSVAKPASTEARAVEHAAPKKKRCAIWSPTNPSAVTC
jgi:hypothetical protein